MKLRTKLAWGLAWMTLPGMGFAIWHIPKGDFALIGIAVWLVTVGIWAWGEIER